nr:hypothetical protein [Tanacetum cinerariifolium]
MDLENVRLRCTCKSCGNDAHHGYNCPSKVSIISNPKPCHDQNVDEFPQNLLSFHPTCYSGDENSFAHDSTLSFANDPPNFFNPPSQPLMYSYEFCGNDAQYGHDCPPRVPFIYNPEPYQRLSHHGDEHLDTILEKESDELIKSSVENFVPILRHSEENLLNPLFNEEIISIKIDPHHLSVGSDLIESLLNQDSSINSSSKIDSLLDEFVGKLILLKSIPPGIDEDDCDPEEEIHLIEKLLYDNSSPRIDSDYSNSEGDNIFPERLLLDDPIPLSDILDFSNVVRVFPPFFTYPVTSSILLSSRSEDTIFDPGIFDYHFSSFMPGVSHQSGTFMKFNVYPKPLNESLMEILSSTCSLIDQ